MERRLASAMVFGAVLAVGADAHAFGGWMATGGFNAVEQRVAVAVTPQRTTLWTSLRFQAEGGWVAVVVPVPAGASVDIASDAWFEALEASTAPRILPPDGQSPYCPGAQGGPDAAVDVAGHLEHGQSLAVAETAVLQSTTAVTAWAGARGLTMSSGLQAGLATLSGVQFVVIRMEAPWGAGLTPTLRVAIPGSNGSLPLGLTQAWGGQLLVSTWFLGNGQARLPGSVPTHLVDYQLGWDAQLQQSNYRAQRLDTLAEPADTLLEAVTHDGLVSATSVNYAVFVDPFVQTYLDRATAYDTSAVDPSTCIPQATAAFSSPSTVAPSCPRGDLLAPIMPCVEMPAAGTIDPASLRCGKRVDDLAVALSGAAPGQVWLTRQSMALWDAGQGKDWSLAFDDPAPVTPARNAGFVDTGNCPQPTPPPDDQGSGPTSGSDTQVDVGGDTTDTTDTTDTSSGGCSGDTTSSDASASDSSGSCGGDSSGGGCSGGDAGGGGCSGGGGDINFDCSIGKRRAPRLAPIVLGALALLAPLRRRGTVSRRGAKGKS